MDGIVQAKGQGQVDVAKKIQQETLTILVVKGGSPCLLGRDWLTYIKLDWHIFSSNEQQNNTLEIVVDSNSDSSLDQYYKSIPVFMDELGTVQGTKAKIYVDSGTKPIYWKARPVPYALRDKIENEIEKNSSGRHNRKCRNFRMVNSDCSNSESG